MRCKTERKGCGKVDLTISHDWQQRIVKTKLRYHQFVFVAWNESYITYCSLLQKVRLSSFVTAHRLPAPTFVCLSPFILQTNVDWRLSPVWGPAQLEGGDRPQ